MTQGGYRRVIDGALCSKSNAEAGVWGRGGWQGRELGASLAPLHGVDLTGTGRTERP